MSWRKIIAWTAAAFGILIVFGIVGGLLFLRTNAFRKMAIRTIIQDTNEATGGRAQIGNFDFHLSTLTAHLYNVTLHGTEPASQPPLLQADKITVGLKIHSILQRKVTLAQLEIEHPVACMQVDRDGKSNLPASPQKTEQQQHQRFRSGCRACSCG